MNLDKVLFKENIKTIIISIVILIFLTIIIFFINKLLFKNYVYSSKLLFVSNNPESKLTKEEFENFKEFLNDNTLINHITNEIKYNFDMDFSENDYKNSISYTKKDGYIIFKGKANNPALAKTIVLETIIYLTVLSTNNAYYPIETNLSETLPLREAILTNSIIGAYIGIFIIVNKKDGEEKGIE